VKGELDQSLGKYHQLEIDFQKISLQKCNLEEQHGKLQSEYKKLGPKGPSF